MKIQFFWTVFRKSCAGISYIVFIKPCQFKNPFRFWKSCLHKSFISQKILKLLCFTKNPVRLFTCSYFELKLAGRVSKSGQTRHEFLQKRRPLEPYFQKLLMLSLRKLRSEQLSCFTFCLIRPLRASKSDYQKTGQFYPKTGSFVFRLVLRPNTRTLPQLPTAGA